MKMDQETKVIGVWLVYLEVKIKTDISSIVINVI